MWFSNESNISFPEPTLYSDASVPTVRVSMPEPQHFQYDTIGVQHTSYPIRAQSSNGAWRGVDMVGPNSNVWARIPSQQPQPPASGYYFGPMEGPSPQWQPPPPTVPPSPIPMSRMRAPSFHRTPSPNSQTPVVHPSTLVGSVSDARRSDGRLSTRHYYNNLPKAVDELDTFRLIFELFGDEFTEHWVRDGKLGSDIRSKMQELKNASLAAVNSARGLCEGYEAFARKVIANLRALCQSDRGHVHPRNPILPDPDLDEMWEHIEGQAKSTKALIGSLNRCTYDLKLLSNDAEDQFGKLNIAQKISNWFSSHKHMARATHAEASGVQSPKSGTDPTTQRETLDRSDLLRRELPVSLKQIQMSLVDFNSHRVLQHEDLKSKMEKLKEHISFEAARRELQEWEILISSLTR